MLAGALSAETYRLAEPRTERPAASLTARSPLGSGAVVAWARALLAAALLVGSAAAVVGGSEVSLAVALAGGALVALAELARRSVAGRRRPLLSAAAAAVDARMRWFAARGLASLELSAAALALGWSVSKLPGDAMGWLRVLVTIGALVLALVALHRARPRPPRAFAGGPAAELRAPAL